MSNEITAAVLVALLLLVVWDRWRTRKRRWLRDQLDMYWYADAYLDAAYYRIHSPTGVGCTQQCRNPTHTKSQS